MSSGGRPPKSAKKKVYNVPSRYKQVSEISVLSSRDKSPSKSSKEVSENSSQDTSCSSKLSTSSQSSRGMTSTPACKGGFPLPAFDASAVTDAHGHLTVPSLKERMVPTAADSVKRNLMKQKISDTTISKGPVIASHKKRNDFFNERIANAEMDILYAQYLQSVFLECEAKKALEARSSAAVKTLHKLLVLIQLHLHKVKSQKVLLKVISIVIEWNKHCQKQHDILKPVFEIIPTLEEQYKCLAEAINVTKHKLPVKDVILAESDAEIQKILQKMNEFLSSFFEALPSYANVISSSDVLEQYVDFGELLINELKRGVSLLTEAQELYFSEASLTLGCEN